MKKDKILFFYFFLLVPIKVYAQTFPQIDFTPPIIPAQTTNTDTQTVEFPQQTLPQFQQVPDITEDEIRDEINPLVKAYLDSTGRPQSLLDPATKAFSYLIIGGDKGLDLFSLDEIKEILQNPATPEIENYLTQFLGKFDITDKDDVANLAAWAGLFSTVSHSLKKLNLENTLDRTILNNLASLITVDKQYTLNEITTILEDENFKTLKDYLTQFLGTEIDLTTKDDVAKLIAWTGLYKFVSAFLGRELNFQNRNDQKILFNFSSLVATDKTYTLNEVKHILADRNTKQLEAALAKFLGKDSLNLTSRSDVVILSHFASLTTTGTYSLNEINAILTNENTENIETILAHFLNKSEIALTDKEEVTILAYLVSFITARGYTLGDIETFINNLSSLVNEGIYSLQEVKTILSNSDLPNLETPIAEMMDKPELDLTRQEDVDF
ncbi:MAG: hypothetical protein J7L14_03995, partial [Candidatus Diapherotrites archaeon]|nr:hypothetical protein [Candidatus Diapherotrites archaeon]